MLSPVGIAYIYGFWVTLPLTAIAAFIWGRWPEQAGAIVYLVALIATELVLGRYASIFISLELGVVVIDALVLGSLIMLALLSGRTWLIWAASFQAIGTLGHLAKMTTPSMSRLAYGLMEGASGWPALIALIAGIVTQRRLAKSSGRSNVS